MLEKISNITAGLLIVLALTGLVFRATLYWRLPVAPGEPVGIADVLELFGYLLILALSALSIILALVVALRRRYATAIRVSMIAVLTPLAFYLLHPLVPRLL